MKLACLLGATTVLLGAALATPGVAVAAAAPRPGCERLERGPDGTHRELAPNVDVTGQLAGTPPRIVTDVTPGERLRLCVGFQNRSGSSISLELDVSNVGIDEQGLPASRAEDAEFGAADWIRLPADSIRELRHGETAWVGIDVQVPRDAPGGSSYASIVATQSTGDAAGEGNRVQAVPAVSLQLFFDAPGDVRREGRIVDARAPGLVWWDGLDVGEVPVLDELRGLGVATIRFRWRNEGNLSDEVAGRVVIESDLSGKDVAKLEIPRRIVLRGATRSFEATWSRGIPMFGRFTPTIEIRRPGGELERRRLDPIWVIPSWWYILALVLAVALPLWWRRRSRRRYEELLARVEAAEARADGVDPWPDDGRWHDEA